VKQNYRKNWATLPLSRELGGKIGLIFSVHICFSGSSPDSSPLENCYPQRLAL
jgi:hypothetical protein